MKVFYAYHDGMYLTGISVIVARARDEAERLLKEELKKHKWIDENKPIELTELDVSGPTVKILADGDY